MKRHYKALMLFLLVAVSSFCHGSDSTPCPDTLRSGVMQHFGIKDFELHSVSEECVIWSYDANFLLSLFVYDVNHDGDKNDNGTKRVMLAVYDRKSGSIANIYDYQIYEDPANEVDSNSLKLDTGRYDLAKGVRAFGVRFNSASDGTGAADHWYGDDLSLFVRNDNTLQKVFEESMAYTSLSEGCMKCGDANRGEYGKLTIGVLPTETHGFHDLQLVDQATQIGGKDDGKQTVTLSILKFDGQKYRLKTEALHN